MVGGKMCVVLTHMVRAIEAHLKKNKNQKNTTHETMGEPSTVLVCLFIFNKAQCGCCRGSFTTCILLFAVSSCLFPQLDHCIMISVPQVDYSFHPIPEGIFFLKSDCALSFQTSFAGVLLLTGFPALTFALLLLSPYWTLFFRASNVD